LKQKLNLLQKNIPITKNHVHVQGILAIYPWFLDILQFSFHFIHQASVTSDLSGCFAGLIVYSMGSINQLHFHNHQSYPSFFHHHHTKGNGWSKKVNFNNWKMKLKINFTFIIINHLHHHHNQLHFHNLIIIIIHALAAEKYPNHQKSCTCTRNFGHLSMISWYFAIFISFHPSSHNYHRISSSLFSTFNFTIFIITFTFIISCLIWILLAIIVK